MYKKNTLFASKIATMDFSLLRSVFNLLGNPNGVALNVVDYINTQGAYMASQADIQRNVDGATATVVGALEKCKILRGSSEKGRLSETIKKGRAVKKYYAINSVAWDHIIALVNNYPT